MSPSSSPPLSDDERPLPHPTDGFSALRFSVGIFVPALSSLVYQPVELCFHDSFSPQSDRPLSLHYQDHRRFSSCTTPPVLGTPTPPCYIIECDPIDIVPPSSRPTIINLRSLTALVCSCCCAVFAIAMASFWSSKEIPQPPCPPLVPVAHVTEPNNILDELLAISEAWAAVPARLFALHRTPLQSEVVRRPREDDEDSNGDDGDNGDDDTQFVRSMNKTAPLAVISQLAVELHNAMLEAGQFDSTRSGYVRSASILRSANAASAVWDLHLQVAANFLWPPRILGHLEWASRRVHRLRDDSIGDSFFFLPLTDYSLSDRTRALDLSRRPLRVSPHGNITIVDSCPIVNKLLETYNTTLLSLLHDDHCVFFSKCRMDPTKQHHPVCQLPSHVSRKHGDVRGDVSHLVSFLERWHDGDLDRAGDSGAPPSSSSETWGQEDEPPVVALARHLAALGAKLDQLISLARDLGLWNPFVPKEPVSSPSTPAGFWGRSRRKHDDARGATASSHRVHGVAARLAALRNSALYSQQLDAVLALTSVRHLCTRLEDAETLIDNLTRGYKWVRVTVENKPLLVNLTAADAQGGGGGGGGSEKQDAVGVVLHGHAVFTHSVLPPPSSQADDIDATHARIQSMLQEAQVVFN